MKKTPEKLIAILLLVMASLSMAYLYLKDKMTSPEKLYKILLLPDTTQQKDVGMNCPDGTIVSVVYGGRLCNRIWEYASAWLVAMLLNRTAFVDSNVRNSLNEVFENLSIRTLNEIKHCNITLGPAMDMKEIEPLDTLAERFKGRHILLPAFTQIFEPMIPFRSILNKELTFRANVLKEAKETIKLAGGEGKTSIGIHVRRGDFKIYLPRKSNASLTNETYFKNAMDWYRQRIAGDVIFLVVSDDYLWCEKNFAHIKDVKIVRKSPAHDLALLTMCNHIIIDYGTYGFWAWFLSKGHTVSLNAERRWRDVWRAAEMNWNIFDKDTLQQITV